ncbi:hypothetical protein DIPPA_00446 [Diplonema papillatum]|nr:hypothetical protein DIPPA_00446 [Diplonema papillatum]KAJ9442411.1 hypothetical protein DIPPA_00446 [Diplonema papillatum]
MMQTVVPTMPMLKMQAVAPTAIAAGQTMKIKDPSAKGNVLYNVPLELIESTYGFKDHYNALFVNTDRKPSHRACLCKLFQERRCGQGENCKSFHVDRTFVKKCRAERNVQLEEQFLNEVVVNTEANLIFAVRFPAVVRTKGLEAYKKIVKRSPDRIQPMALCEQYNPGLGKIGECPADRSCGKIHIKHAELKDLNEARLRTPCCHAHGARNLTPAVLSYTAVVDIQGKKWTVDPHKLAMTDGLHLGQFVYDAEGVCLLHIKSRCKYGRSCDRLHVCRAYAEKTKMLDSLERVSTQHVSPATTPRSNGTAGLCRRDSQSMPMSRNASGIVERTNRSGSLSSGSSLGYTPPPTPPPQDFTDSQALRQPTNFVTLRPLKVPEAVVQPEIPDCQSDSSDCDDMPDLLDSMTPLYMTPFTRANQHEGERELSFANWNPDQPPVIRFYE